MGPGYKGSRHKGSRHNGSRPVSFLRSRGGQPLDRLKWKGRRGHSLNRPAGKQVGGWAAGRLGRRTGGWAGGWVGGWGGGLLPFHHILHQTPGPVHEGCPARCMCTCLLLPEAPTRSKTWPFMLAVPSCCYCLAVPPPWSPCARSSSSWPLRASWLSARSHAGWHRGSGWTWTSHQMARWALGL